MGDLVSATQKNGSCVGKYRILVPLGQGGMADVHLARMRGPVGFDRLAVIKQIRPQLADDPEVVRMFLDEARIAARLTHPNVVHTYEVGQEGQRYFLAMEFLDGQPLSRVRSVLQDLGGLPLAMHLRVIVDVLAGLNHAHELRDYDGSALGLVHRDVTPQNVFVTYAGAVKIVDFGIAKATCSTVETRSGTFKGKVTYMPREQALGERVDRRADVFSVGVMLWEAVAGQRPWSGLDQSAILHRLVAGRFPPLRGACPGVPAELEAIVHKALAPAREDRYATAAAFQGALEAYLEQCGDHTHPRDLAGLLDLHFAPERDALRSLIRAQMRAGHEEKSVRRAAVPRVAAPIVEERCTVPEPAVARLRSGSYTPTRAGSFSAIEGPVPERPRLPRRRSLVSLGLLAFAVLMAGIVHSLPVRFPRVAGEAPGGGLGASPIVKPSYVPASAAPETAPTVRQASNPAPEINLLVTATPSAATIFLDGVQLGRSSSRTMAPRDGAPHEIRVEAPGFAAGVEQVVFDHDRAVSIALDAEPVGDVYAPRRPRPSWR